MRDHGRKAGGIQAAITRTIAMRRLSVWILMFSLATGCRSGPQTAANSRASADPMHPSHDRRWQPTLAVLPTAKIKDDRIEVRNIRNCLYFTEDAYVVRHYDKTYRLDDIESVDFIVVPFKETANLAHTMLSFGFRGGDYLAVSVEARLEEGETYSAWLGAARQYELMYVVADERDVVKLRTDHRNVDVLVYRTRVEREQVGELFVDVMRRVNAIAKQAEFYDTLRNNCTTNIVAHVNRIRPGRIPRSLSVVLTGHSDRLAYDLGLIDTALPFEQARANARINDLARQFADAPDFSARIRR